MDVYCATCQEPWEDFFMLHEAVWDAWDGIDNSSSHLLIQRFLSGSKTSLSSMLRDDLKEKGWVFGKTVISILECPCCASNAGEDEGNELVKRRKAIRLEVEALLGDDLDGLISTM